MNVRATIGRPPQPRSGSTKHGGDFIKRFFPIYRYVRDILDFLRPMQIPLHSAYTVFFLILSLFPSMLLLLGLLKYTPLGVPELMAFLEGLLPQALLPVAQGVVQASFDHSSGAIVSVSAIAGLWSASRGMYGLLGGLNAIYAVQSRRGYFRSRIVSMLYTFFFLLVLIATVLLYVFGNTIFDYLQMTTQPLVMTAMGLLDFRSLLLLVLQIALFALLYAWLPAGRNRYKKSLPGATLAALGWMGSSKLFSVYVTYFASYTNIFGSLYGLALGMLWLYFCISVIFYGGALNRLLSRSDRQ